MTAACWVNGEPQDHIPVADRGLQYGDGLFETLPVIQGQIALLDYHLDRLHAGCRRLAVSAPPRSQLHGELVSAARKQQRAVLKLIITRGMGGRGYRPQSHAQTTRILMRHAWPEYPPAWFESGVELRICTTRLGRNPGLAGIKHLNRLEQVLARAEWSDRDPWQEGLMLDEEATVIEGTMTNLFARLSDGRRITPDVRNCGVAGVMRRYLLECGVRAHAPVNEARVTLQDLQQASEVFVCNSLIGIWPVRRIGDQAYSVGEWTRRMQQYARDQGIGVE